MLVKVIKQCDATVGGRRKALFPGQTYNIPDDQAKALTSEGLVEAVGKKAAS